MDGCLLVCSLDGWLPGRSPIARAAEAIYICNIYMFYVASAAIRARGVRGGFPASHRLLDGMQPIWNVAYLACSHFVCSLDGRLRLGGCL